MTASPRSGGSGGRARPAPAYRWCFTVNNWTEEEYGLIASIPRSSVKYLIIGKEVGESGTPHLQGFVNFKKKLRRSALKRLPGFTRAHVQSANGTDLENQRYCQKGGQYLEIGCPSRPGKSSALTEAIQDLQRSRGNLNEVARMHPEVYVRHGRGLRDYVFTAGLVGQRAWKSEVIVIIGKPGVGKTRYVNREVEGKTVYWKPRGPWWDGYMNHEVVIFDDFYGWVAFDELLRVCDRYPLKVPVKGAFVEFVAKYVYFTSNKPPEEWYDKENIRGNIEAFFRRINEYLVIEEGVVKEGQPIYEINY
ncbi:replication-associated protein [Circovirus ialtag]|uniref:Replication-associated protein n=1 Tax=Circovirus ialtag TaxID=3052124 RepID=A0A510E9T7_9CIRC|nr:replication-associated protein [Circovirus ialtag]BBI18987.1 replication-associated protein [Circovirus ialtag]